MSFVRSFTTIRASLEVNFLAGVSFLSPPFSLLHRLVGGDHRYWHRAVAPRFSGQPPPPHALLCPREVVDSGHGARTKRAAESRLEGVDRQKLKFTTLSTLQAGVSVRIKSESGRKRGKQINQENKRMTR
jgi:hypothetical protein